MSYLLPPERQTPFQVQFNNSISAFYLRHIVMENVDLEGFRKWKLDLFSLLDKVCFYTSEQQTESWFSFWAAVPFWVAHRYS